MKFRDFIGTGHNTTLWLSRKGDLQDMVTNLETPPNRSDGHIEYSLPGESKNA